MAQTSVSSCVLSIIASFTSGLDVFRKFQDSRKKKKRRSRKNASGDDEELRLARSLRQGPEDIGKEYQRSIHAAGEQFAHGDGIAQTALAEILVKLNTGLVTIIRTFLTRDKQDVKLNYESLTSLSERSRRDTCHTLRQLHRRMMQIRLPAQMSSEDELHRTNLRGGSKVSGASKRKIGSPRHTKVRQPMLARVVIADSSRPSQVAMVRPGERKKKSGSSLSSASPKVQSNTSLALPPELPARPPNYRSPTIPEVPRPRRKQSAMEFSSQPLAPVPERLRATQSTPRLAKTSRGYAPPPMPTIPALPDIEPRRRKPTPTYYSIDSDNTKLGEIPMHKWAEPYDFDAMSRLNREAEKNGWPVSALDNDQNRMKKKGIFRFFRRHRSGD